MQTKFKTTVLAAALAAAFSAQAADVSLYGSVSTGLLYKNTFSMTNGQGNDRVKTDSVD